MCWDFFLFFVDGFRPGIRVRRRLVEALLHHVLHHAAPNLIMIVVMAWRFLQAQVFRIDRLLVDAAELLGTQIAHPIAPKRAAAILPERFDIDNGAGIRSAGAVVMLGKYT